MLALRSAWGSASAEASLAASSIDAPVASALATWVARMGVEPMLTSPMPAVVSLRQAATPTMAQSWARRVDFLEFPPAPVLFGDLDFGDDFVGLEGGFEEAEVEVFGGDGAGAAGSLDDVVGVEGEGGGGEV